MLLSLSVKNFALIEDLEVNFSNGLNIITGETGSGKSIILGALSLLLGKRADHTSLKIKNKKCIVEASFILEKDTFYQIFEKFDLDFHIDTIFRREINSNGKSRSFINDTPVNLDKLKTIGDRIIDIHMQRENLQLTNKNYFLTLLDSFSENNDLASKVRKNFYIWDRYNKELELKTIEKNELKKNYDYNKFLLDELEKINLLPNLIEELSQEQKILNSYDNIKQTTSKIIALGRQETHGVTDKLVEINKFSNSISEIDSDFKSLNKRIESLRAEFDDILHELEYKFENSVGDPKKLEEINNKLNLLYNLCSKHNVSSTNELITIRDNLYESCQNLELFDNEIEDLNIKISESILALKTSSKKLSLERQKNIKPLEDLLMSLSKDLGMEHIKFKFNVVKLDEPSLFGNENVELLFSPNKGTDLSPLHKTASGGELSRIMLIIKSIISKKTYLPCLILDEIDTGISGEMAKKMGKKLFDMSEFLQIISITHLPQIAAFANNHYKVFKKQSENTTKTFLKKLNEDEKIIEIAEMLGGKEIKDSALKHAKELKKI